MSTTNELRVSPAADLFGGITREAFIASYCESSGVTWEWLSGPEGLRVALPCACGDEMCQGWAMVRNDPDSIQTHQQFNAPEKKPNAATLARAAQGVDPATE